MSCCFCFEAVGEALNDLTRAYGVYLEALYGHWHWDF